MPLQKQTVTLPFGQGLDQKIDPKQVTPGKYSSLKNVRFQKQNQLTKRYGFEKLPDVGHLVTTLASLNQSIVALGDFLSFYSNETNLWYNQGPFASAQLEIKQASRGPNSQTNCDSATNVDGITCIVWEDTKVVYTNGAAVNEAVYKYKIIDADGNAIIEATEFGTPTTSAQLLAGNIQTALAKVVIFNGRFVISYYEVGPYITYFTIPFTSYTAPTVPVQMNIVSTNGYYDCFVSTLADRLYFYTGNGASILTYVLNDFSWPAVIASVTAPSATTILQVSVTADDTGITPVIWVAYTTLDVSTSRVYAASFTQNIVPVLASTQLWSYLAPSGYSSLFGYITCIAQNNVLNAYWDFLERQQDPYNYFYIQSNTVTSLGVIGTTVTIKREQVLGAKPFIISGSIYTLGFFSTIRFFNPVSTNISPVNYQPTYFLMDATGSVLGKFAYSNGGGSWAVNQYLDNVGGFFTPGALASTTVLNDEVYLSYLIKDQITGINKSPSAVDAGGTYAQTGINLAHYSFNQVQHPVLEAAGAVLTSAAQSWEYDGESITESGTSVWPEDVLPSNTIVFKGHTTFGSAFITAPSSLEGLFAVTTDRMTLVGTGVAIGAEISGVDTTLNRVQMSLPATATGTVSITATAHGTMGSTSEVFNYVATYEWTDAAGNLYRSAPSIAATFTDTTGGAVVAVPTLKVTAKNSTANPVSIVLYRWSTTNQVFYQITSVGGSLGTTRLINDPSVDFVFYLDQKADSQIIGNNILYTTGGVLENIAPPAFSDVTLFKSRVVGLDAEVPNTIWYSKQIVQNTPVEFNDALTLYVGPNVTSQGTPGPVTAIETLDDKLICFKSNSLFYIVGDGPDNTGNNNNFSDPVFITAAVGTNEPNSVVATPMGIMFKSDKGIWILKRDLSVDYIGSSVETHNSSAITSAVAVPDTTEVRFTLDTGTTLIYDYYFNQWAESDPLDAVTSTIANDLHHYAKPNGDILRQTPDEYLDDLEPVTFSFVTAWFKMSGLQGLERSYFFYFLAEYLSPHKLQIGISYDYDDTIVQTLTITPSDLESVEQWRVFLKRQKCQSFKLTIQEIFDTVSGPGLTMSGIDLTIGMKKHYNTLKASRSAS